MSSFSHSSKTVTAAELVKLEQSFAANPSSDAWLPLAEAYLAMSRYMEAMVVARKGARAQPNSPRPRVVLAEVYAAQGKDAKAKEEIQAALQMAPGDMVALRLCGHLQMKLGEREEGTAKLLAAAKADVTDMKTQALLAEWGIPMPVPPPVTVAAAGRVLASPSSPTLPSAGPPVVPQGFARQVAVSAAPTAPTFPAAPAFPVAGGMSAPVSASAPPMPLMVSAPPVRRPEWIAPADLEEPKKRASSNTALWSLVILFIGVAGGGIYYFWGQHKAEQQQKVTRALLEAETQFRLDNHAAYQKAADHAREAIRFNSSSAAAHAYLAYAQVIRATEHAGGDSALEEARRHLAIAKQSGEELSYMHMAEALLESYFGRVEQAERVLSAIVQKHESEGRKPARLLMTLGALQMDLGDLDAASESLEKSQSIAPEPRVYALSGKLARQKGSTSEARRLYEAALRQERSHPDSLIGRSWALLEQEEPNASYIDASDNIYHLLGGTLELSVRQQAMALMLQSLLVARVLVDLPLLQPPEFRERLRVAARMGTREQNLKTIQESDTGAELIDGKNPELRLIRAQRFAAEKRMNDAIQEANKLISEVPSRVHFRIELARLWMRRNAASKEAESVLRAAETMAPRNPVIPVLLARVLLSQNKVDSAIGVLQNALKTTESVTVKNPEAKMLLAQSFREHKRDYPQAVALYTGAASEFGRDKVNVARSYLELGITYERMGDSQKAKEAYEQAMTVDYAYEQAYCNLAKLLESSADAQDKERLQRLAEVYWRAWTQGECTSLQRFKP